MIKPFPVSHACPHCGSEIVPAITLPQQPTTVATLWARAFGADYFDALERKEQLTGLLSQWEDVSYRNDMMPSFILHRFTITSDKSEQICLKLWCGYEDSDGSFIANMVLVDNDGGWLCELDSACDLLAILGVYTSRTEPASMDDLIDALSTFSQLSITSEQEASFYQQYAGQLPTPIQ